jgi:hypothetical protein
MLSSMVHLWAVGIDYENAVFKVFSHGERNCVKRSTGFLPVPKIILPVLLVVPGAAHHRLKS